MKKFFLAIIPVLIISVSCKKTIPDSVNNPTPKDSVITTVAGNGTWGFSGDGGLATNAQISPSAKWVTIDNNGNIYIADDANNRIRKVSTNGIISTVVGNGVAGNSPDGTPALSLKTSFTKGLYSDANGTLFFTDNHLVRKLNTNGTITTIAGNGSQSSANDGDGEIATAPKANLYLTDDIIYDAAGNLFIADAGHQKVRKVSAANNIITTICGTGQAGFSGDGGLATAAKISYPSGLAIDSKGNIYIASDQRIRKINTAGIIMTVAGTGSGAFNGLSGTATSINIWPADITINNKDELIIADYGIGLVRKVDANGYLTTIAGNGNILGDGGKPYLGKLVYPSGVACDASGNIYIADYGDKRVRKITVR